MTIYRMVLISLQLHSAIANTDLTHSHSIVNILAVGVRVCSFSCRGWPLLLSAGFVLPLWPTPCPVTYAAMPTVVGLLSRLTRLAAACWLFGHLPPQQLAVSCFWWPAATVQLVIAAMPLYLCHGSRYPTYIVNVFTTCRYHLARVFGGMPPNLISHSNPPNTSTYIIIIPFLFLS